MNRIASIFRRKPKEKNRGMKDEVSTPYPINASKRDSFRLIAKVYGFSIGALILMMIWMQWNYKQLLSEREQEVYVVRDDRVYHAMKQESMEREIYEFENHLRLFMYNGFSYNKHNFDERISLALELLDNESGLAFYNGLSKARTKDRLISLNCSAELIIDSLIVERQADKVMGRVLFEQQTHFEDNSISKLYEIQAVMRPVKRSPQNGYGVEMYNVNYYAYERGKDVVVR